MTALMKVRKTIEREFPGLGAKIKQARNMDARSLTQLCAEVNMTPANWYKIENEETKVLPLQTLRNIESVLNVDLGVNLDD
jgi:transcriptional regulator with XRE-family HTH domain